MVSLVLVETGLPLEGAKNQYSMRWENAFFDVFFDAGYILCNSPMLRFDIKPARSMEYMIQDEMEEARQGGADYFIIAQLDYVPGSMRPGEISLMMYTITPSKKIYEKKISGKAYRSENEEANDLKAIIRGLVSQIRT
jgi:hypothetical protein